MAASASELLEDVSTAIRNTLTAQSYSAPGGRQKQMADLRALMQFRKDLMDEVSAASEGGGSMCSLLQMWGPQ